MTESGGLENYIDGLCNAADAASVFAEDSTSGQVAMFRDLPDLCEEFTRMVSERITQRSGRLLLRSRSAFSFTIVYLALLRKGITIIPIALTTPAAMVAAIAAEANADGIVEDGDSSESANLPLNMRIKMTPRMSGNNAPPLDAAHVRPAVILFTSGTTGRPKGVMLGVENLFTNAIDLADALEIHKSRLLGVLPLQHANGQMFNILIPLVTESTVVCSDYSVTSLSKLWATIERYRVEIVDVVPTMIKALLALPNTKDPDVSGLRYFVCGAGPISRDVLAAFEYRFATTVLQEYGLTEATCVSSIETPRRRKLGTIGTPLPGNTIEVRDPAGRSVAVGERGEFWIRGPYVMLGYLGGSDDYGLAVEAGWLSTGDIGYRDADGFLTIVGRSKNVIIRGGLSIMPEDIERVAHRATCVVDAAAVGRPNHFYGQVVELLVVWQDDIPAVGELNAVLHDGLPREMLPYRITTATEIPRTPGGKICREQLK